MPDVVTGDPETVNIEGKDKATDVTVPNPAAEAHANPVPLYCKYVLAIVGAVINDVVPDAVLYGICKLEPPAIFVAVVADVAVAALPPIDKLDAVPVNPVPAPLNDVAVKTPVFGTKLILVELVVAGLLPLVATDKTG